MVGKYIMIFLLFALQHFIIFLVQCVNGTQLQSAVLLRV
jgi:hypothetical protein